MQKAFTLSEVLLSLVIMGVIAAITVPSLMNNINKQQYISAYLKMYSSICQVYNRVKTDNGGSLDSVFQENDDYPRILQRYFSGSKVCSAYQTTGKCWPDKWYTISGGIVSSNENFSSSLILNDGSIILFLHISSECTGSTELNTNTGCVRLRTDINGFKGPNRVGRDIYDFYLLDDRVIARGDPLSTTDISQESGWGKGYQILTMGKL